MTASGISILAALLYLSFLSGHFIGDGIRWLPAITQSHHPPIGDVRHLLSPTLGWAWYHLALLLGYRGDPIPLIQSMNALLAGVGIGLYYRFLERVTRDRTASAWGCLLLLFSYSYSTHATDMTEIMPSFPVLIASLLLSLRSARLKSHLLAAGSALLFSVAGVIYVTSLLCGLVPIFLLVKGADPDQPPDLRLARTFFLSLLLFVPILFIFSYLLQYPNPLEAARAILAFRERGLANPDFNWIHLGGTFFGWAGAFLGLRDFNGGLHLLLNPMTGWARWNLGVLLFMTAMMAALGLPLFSALKGQPHSRRPIGDLWVPLAFLWLAPEILFLGYVGPSNNKIWVHPLPGFICLISCVLAFLLRFSRQKTWVRIWACALLGVVAGVNGALYWIPRRFTPSPYWEDAQRVSGTMNKEGLLVSESYDSVTNYAGAIFRKDVFSFFIRGAELGFDNAALEDSLRQTVARHLESGGHAYFLSLFDPPPGGWGLGLGGKRGLDYTMLDAYRRRSVRIFLIPSLTKEYRRPVWLWEYKGESR